jgi:monoamine oxidase
LRQLCNKVASGLARRRLSVVAGRFGADAGLAGVVASGSSSRASIEVVMPSRQRSGLRSTMERAGIEPATSGLQTQSQFSNVESEAASRHALKPLKSTP